MTKNEHKRTSDEIQRYRPSAAEVLQRYIDENLPEFCGVTLTDVNQAGLFGDFPLGVAACRGNIDEVRALLEGGAYVDAPGEHGYTALHDAVSQQHLLAVKLLLDHGASRDLRNEFGDTPLDIARQRRYSEILNLLESPKIVG